MQGRANCINLDEKHYSTTLHHLTSAVSGKGHCSQKHMNTSCRWYSQIQNPFNLSPFVSHHNPMQPCQPDQVFEGTVNGDVKHISWFTFSESKLFPCSWEYSTHRASKSFNKWWPEQLWEPGFYHPFELGHLYSSIQINNGVESAGMVYSSSQDLNHGKAVRFYCTLRKCF